MRKTERPRTAKKLNVTMSSSSSTTSLNGMKKQKMSLVTPAVKQEKEAIKKSFSDLKKQAIGGTTSEIRPLNELVKHRRVINNEEAAKMLGYWTQYKPQKFEQEDEVENELTAGKTSGTASFIEPNTPILRLTRQAGSKK